METIENGVRLHQTEYAKRLKVLPSDCSFKEYRSKRQKLQWLTHCRPDICCAVNKASQITERNFGKAAIEALNKVITHVHKTTERGILQEKLDLNSLHIRVYTDGSFADNDDLTTQLGYIVLLCDDHDRCNVLNFSSHKSRRVVRSVLGGETYAFADGMDFGLSMKYDIEAMIDRKIPLRLFTDSKSLFDVITKNTVTFV